MKAKSLQKSRAETSASSEFLSLLRISEIFVLYSRLLADFLSHSGKWVKLIKFEAGNEFFLAAGGSVTNNHMRSE